MKISLRFLFPFIFVIFSCTSIAAQDNYDKIQWACEVTSCSQQYTNDSYSAKQVLGLPEVYPTRPRAGSQSYLFGFREKEDDEAIGEIHISVKFCHPQKANRVIIAENKSPGTITGVYLIDSDGKETRVYQSQVASHSAPKRLLQVEFPYTNFLIHGVKITGEPSHDIAWNAIDGIGIAESSTKIQFPAITQNLGPAINSTLSELSPRISPDGRTLYFSIEGHPNSAGAKVKDDDKDIWYSELNDNGEWTQAQSMGSPWNNTSYNWLIGIMPDGNTAILSGHYNAIGQYAGPGVSRSTRTQNGWSIPKPIEIDKLVNKANTADYYLSSDGKILLMAIKGPKSVGRHDLYVSFLIGKNHFSKPQNLGKTLNTKNLEYAPFLAPDGKTLYFSSNGRGGFGNNDIFVSKRLDDSWAKWSEPENLGEEVNSENFDSDFSISAKGDYAYLVKYHDSYGKGDVMQVPIQKSHRPDPVVLIYGKVLNQKTGVPIMAEISYEDLDQGVNIGKANSEPENGNYRIVLPFGKHYGFMAQSDGYYAITENIDLSTISEYQEIERDLYLAPIEVGEVVRLNNVFFDFGKTDLLPSSFPELDRVIKLLNENPGITIELGGHTDNVGAYNDNLKLSALRANAVRNYLIQSNLSESRITAAIGFGETAPVADNSTDEGRQLNRRVEFKIIEK